MGKISQMESMERLEEMNLPTVSVIMPTLNSARTLEECLSSICTQDYPQNKIEILIIDGGSTDKTKEISSKYDCKFIEGGYRNNQEPRKAIGLHTAAGEIVSYIDSDNILPDKNWFKQMVQPFLDDSEVVGTQNIRYGIKKGFSLFNRYCALTGVNDPLSLYLHKNEKLPWITDKWDLTDTLYDKGDYFVVNFTQDNMPTIGGNGFFIKRDIQLKSICDPNEFFHIDVVMDVVKMGYTRFAMVRNEIYHDTASSLAKLTSRRREYFLTHNPAHSNRRYLLFNSKSNRDRLNLFLFILYTVTLIQPIIFAIRGYLKKPDSAWFLHPVVCLSFLWAYTGGVFSLHRTQ